MPRINQSLVGLLPKEAQKYETPQCYIADIKNKISWFFKLNKKETGYLTVRKRSARMIAYNPDGTIDYANCVYDDNDWKYVTKLKGNLLTNGGRDFVHAQVLTNTAAGTRGANGVGVSVNTGGADVAHTAVAGEITTGGLTRKVADTITHSAGTNTAQFITTFTATATHTAVQLAGTFNNIVSGGTLTHENTFTATTLNNTDQLELTWGFTYG